MPFSPVLQVKRPKEVAVLLPKYNSLSMTDTFSGTLQSPLLFLGTTSLCLEEGIQAGLGCHPAVTITFLDLKTHSGSKVLWETPLQHHQGTYTSREECFNDVVMIYWPSKGLLKSRPC